MIIKIKPTHNDSNRLVFNNKKKETIKERFAKESIPGIISAGNTIKLDRIYIILFCFNQENILINNRNIYIFSKQIKCWQIQFKNY